MAVMMMMRATARPDCICCGDGLGRSCFVLSFFFLTSTIASGQWETAVELVELPRHCHVSPPHNLFTLPLTSFSPAPSPKH
jgi:hypothetical protein